MFQGFFPIDKPIGLRSSDCIERVKRVLEKGTRIGHGGTLDSSAGGVLVLLLGGATRLSAYVMMMRKVYRAVIKLGSETTTCDYTGEVTRVGETTTIKESDIDRLIPSFTGWRMQIPPEVSAVHVKGRRAHEIFRSGGDPAILPRPVFIEKIEKTSCLSGNGEVEFLLRCGKGTYVRAIARDIGRRLGCGAHIASLRREAVGPFNEGNALYPGEDFRISMDDISFHIKPMESVGDFLPRYTVCDASARALASGQEVPFSLAVRETCGNFCVGDTIVIAGDSLLTIGSLIRSAGTTLIKPLVNIPKVESLTGYSR